MVLSDFLLSYCVVQQISGKFKVDYKNTSKNIIKKVLLSSILLFGSLGLIFRFISEFLLPLLSQQGFNLGELLIFIIFCYSVYYLISISPFLQNKKNYRFEIGDQIKIFYKNKEIRFNYIELENGKIDFADLRNKNKCISYVDGSKMSGRLQYQIANYIAMVLNRAGIINEQRAVFN